MRTRDVLSFFSFLFLNFTALAVGGFFTKDGATSEWYLSLMKAPWTPPGWVFGASWTLIMLSLSALNYFMWKGKERTFLHLWIQGWIFNFLWNPMFFSLKSVELSLVIITYLLILVSSMFYITFKRYKYIHLLLLPYIIWLIIATSLNAYVVIYN